MSLLLELKNQTTLIQFLRFASAIVLRIGFGVSLTRDDDPYIQLAADANEATGGGGSPGGSIVDYFPFLSHFPTWLVRSSALQHAKDWGWAIQKLHDVPFAATRKEFVCTISPRLKPVLKVVQEAGNAQTSSYVYPLLTKHAENERAGIPNDFSMADINGSAAAIFVAGSGTTFTTTLVVILNLLLNPEVFKKARADIDRVIGTDRLPTLKDRENPELKYLEYIIEETVRWRPLSPVGIPHKSLKDDIYNGMLIPKGSHIYFNAWAMSRDGSVYKDPELFNPDRFRPKESGGSGEPYLQAPFGFGRRICVGMHLALASVWIELATIVATMDIKSPAGSHGEEIKPIVEFSTGLSSHPAHFDCIFKPRSLQAELLLANSFN
jgi:cytochrome P450